MVDVGAATAAEVARMLREITATVDRGELAAPRWLRERVRAATVAMSERCDTPTERWDAA